jgi:hypothetical protein
VASGRLHTMIGKIEEDVGSVSLDGMVQRRRIPDEHK